MANEWIRFSQGRADADYRLVPLAESRRQQIRKNMTTILHGKGNEILPGEWSMSITIIDTVKNSDWV